MIPRTVIIAEAGVNHNGDLATARQLIRAAAEAKADYVKFQTFTPEHLVSVYARQAGYQRQNAAELDGSQLAMLRRLALPSNSYAELFEECQVCGIRFLSSPFDLQSVELLSRFGMDFWKIPSGEITNLPYLRKIAATHKPVVMSTGMSSIEEVDLAIKVLLNSGVPSIDDITVLHCNTQYPTPMADVNLRAMLRMRDLFGVKVGYSDHTLGIEVPIAAVAMGASVVEKHFTLDRSMAGPDHKASLEPTELKAMVASIRNVEMALGNGEKSVSSSERENISVARKSIVAARPIKAGDVFSDSNLTVKRPGTGISPMRWDDVIGMVARRDFAEDELVEL